MGTSDYSIRRSSRTCPNKNPERSIARGSTPTKQADVNMNSSFQPSQAILVIEPESLFERGRQFM